MSWATASVVTAALEIITSGYTRIALKSLMVIQHKPFRRTRTQYIRTHLGVPQLQSSGDLGVPQLQSSGDLGVPQLHSSGDLGVPQLHSSGDLGVPQLHSSVSLVSHNYIALCSWCPTAT